MEQPQYTVTITSLPESTIEITGTIPWDSFKKFEKKAFDTILAELEIPGFRKGHVPEDVAKKQIKDELLLADMAELAVQSLYPTMLSEKKIDAIGSPSLAITKLARDTELGFTIRTAVFPSITLPSYTEIAKQIPKTSSETVTEEDIEKVIQELRQIRAYGHVHQPEENHEHDHGDTPLPEVNDDFAKSFGNFASVAEMREKIKENMLREKEQEAKDKHRITIMEAIIEKTPFELPSIIVTAEQEKILAQIETDIARSGMTIDDYLKQIQKTKEAVMEEFKPEAEKRARFQLVVNAIATDASLTASDEEVQAEAEQLMKAYPGADRQRAVAYADMVLTNEKVLSMLESQA